MKYRTIPKMREILATIPPEIEQNPDYRGFVDGLRELHAIIGQETAYKLLIQSMILVNLEEIRGMLDADRDTEVIGRLDRLHNIIIDRMDGQ